MGFGAGLTGGISAGTALNRNNIQGQLGVAQLQQQDREQQFKQQQAKLAQLNQRLEGATEEIQQIVATRGREAAQQFVERFFTPSVLEGLSLGFQQAGRPVTPEQIRDQLTRATLATPTPLETGAATGASAAAEAATGGAASEAGARAANVSIAQAQERRLQAEAAKPKLRFVVDRTTGDTRFATEAEIAQAPGNFAEPPASETTDSFFRALDALEQTRQGIATGDLDLDDPVVRERVDLLENRVNSLSQQSGFGFSVQLDKEGKVTAISGGNVGQTQPEGGGVGLFPGLTPSQQLSQRQRLTSLNENIGIIDGLITALDEDPSRFGALGSVRRGAQVTAGVASDLSSLISDVTGGVVDLKGVAKGLQERFGGEGLEIFDPALSEMGLLENVLAFELARTRLERGSGEIRALGQVFKDAKKDINLTGFTSSEDVKNRLLRVRELFGTELRALSEGLSGEQADPGQPPGGTVRPEGLSDEELDRQVNEILGVGQ